MYLLLLWWYVMIHWCGVLTLRLLSVHHYPHSLPQLVSCVLDCTKLICSPHSSNELHEFTISTTEWHHHWWTFNTSYSRYTSDLPMWRWTVPWGHNDCHLSSYRRVGQKPRGDRLHRQVYSLIEVVILLYTLNQLQLFLIPVIAPAYLMEFDLMQLSPSVWLSS